MYNWSVDTGFLQKYPEKYEVWHLEQLINFGLGDELLDSSQLIRNLNELNIDPLKKKYLQFILSSK